MSLRIADPDAGVQILEEWDFRRLPPFLTSSAAQALTEDLKRYLRGDIEGRSFLIAGHRGAGKTSTVLRVAEDAYRNEIAAALDRVKSTADAAPRAFQRPLLVKLHGPSLRAAVTGPGAGTAASDLPHVTLVQITISLYRALAAEVARCFARHARAAQRGTAAMPPPMNVPTGDDGLELASQLALDLDQGCDPSALRGYWNQLGRLGTGVLWPASVGAALSSAGYADRGLREIMAVATAGQAFQVCSGRVTYTVTNKDAANREASVDVTGKLDTKDAINKLWGLTAGGLIGAALYRHSAAAAAIGGLGAGLFSTFAMGWSGRRSLRNERGSDYRFVTEPTIANLDRDLPVVIGRIRDAGLAPVFLVDELDKLDNGGTFIPEIINRLKNLTTDYGFFCFLTDRDYFESIDRTIRGGAYPKEASYFSKRLLIAHHPAAMGHHVHERIVPVNPTTPGDQAARWILSCVVPYRAKGNMLDLVRGLTSQGDLPAASEILSSAEHLWPMVIQLAIEHVLRKPELRRRAESHLEFLQIALDALYMIPRAWEDGHDTVDLGDLGFRRHLIDRLRVPGLIAAERERAFDAMISKADITLLHDQVLALANLLRKFTQVRDAIAAEADFQSSILLTDPVMIFNRDRFNGLQSLFGSMPGGPDTGLLEIDTATTGIWRFKVFPDGRVKPPAAPPPPPAAPISAPPSPPPPEPLVQPVPEAQPVIPVETAPVPPPASEPPTVPPATPRPVAPSSPRALPPETKAGIDGAVGEYTAFLALFPWQGLELRTLVETHVLPPNFVLEQLNQVTDSLLRASSASQPYRELNTDLALLRGTAGLLQRNRAAIATVFAFAARIRRDAGGSATMADALAAIDRLLGLEAVMALMAEPEPSSRERLRTALKSPRSPFIDQVFLPPSTRTAETGETPDWRGMIAAEEARIFGLSEIAYTSDADEAWHVWVMRFHFATGRGTEDRPLAYAELVHRVALRLPSSVLSGCAISHTSIAEWSRLAMEVFNDNRRSRVPGMEHLPTRIRLELCCRVLGFGGRVLEAATSPPDGGTTSIWWPWSNEPIPPDRLGSILFYDAPPSGSVAAMPAQDGAPIFAVPYAEEAAYAGIIEWLQHAGPIGYIGGEDEADE